MVPLRGDKNWVKYGPKKSSKLNVLFLAAVCKLKPGDRYNGQDQQQRLYGN